MFLFFLLQKLFAKDQAFPIQKDEVAMEWSFKSWQFE